VKNRRGAEFGGDRRQCPTGRFQQAHSALAVDGNYDILIGVAFGGRVQDVLCLLNKRAHERLIGGAGRFFGEISIMQKSGRDIT